MSSTEPDIRTLGEELRNRLRSAPDESTAVALAALSHVGKAYRRTRELLPGHIDCSTIVSQAHWEGAGVQTPFIAESQRLAYSATTVDSLDDTLPGDVLVAYPSRDHAPEGRHNHVALLLWRGSDGEGWAVEARENSTARIMPLGEAAFLGGIRRFCPNPLTVYPDGPWRLLALRTPKLGRLGARLTAQYGSTRRHRGIDVYTRAGSPVFAPISGKISILCRGERQRRSIAIRNPRDGVSSLLAPILPLPDIASGDEIKRGDLVGEIDSAHRWFGCNVLVSMPGLWPLHWELWSTADLGYPAAPDAGVPDEPVLESGSRAYNPIYAVKLGSVGSPLALGV